MIIFTIFKTGYKRFIRKKDYMIYFVRGVKMKSEINIDEIQKVDIPAHKIKPYLLNSPINSNRNFQSLDAVFDKYAINRECSSEIEAFSKIKTITLDYRCKILIECGFKKLSTESLGKYIRFVSKRTIKDLKEAGLLKKDVDVQGRLVKCLSLWPTSPPMSEVLSDNMTLLEARMRVLSRYLELKIDLPPETFRKCVLTYPRIKHRPLSQIDGVLNIIQSCIKIPNKKIATHFAILHADLENVKQILEIRSLAGVDIKEIIQRKPILLNVNHKSFHNIQTLLIDEGITEDAQRRCFEIYTLGYETVKERLREIKKMPDFQCLINNLRVLRLVFYKRKVDERLQYFKTIDKKCVSLNILSGPNETFHLYVNSQGDRTKGTDSVNNICSILGDKFSTSEVRKAMARHSFSTNVPSIHLHIVHDKLKSTFSSHDIFSNCYILLYQWNSIEHWLTPLMKSYEEKNTDHKVTVRHVVDMSRVTKKQILSLVLYFIERDYHFNNTGIWKNLTQKDQDTTSCLNELKMGIDTGFAS